MKNDAEEFWYPEVDYNKCIKCGLCIKVCPIINKTVVDNQPVAYSCINKNEKIRLESTSGGIFTLVAEQILDDGGAVFGAAFNENFEVEHNYIKTKDGLAFLRGSKYVQSKIGDTYIKTKEFLNQGKKVLFSGTPCQIGGLKSYLGNDFENLFCIDIICHGVPSPKVWRKYIYFRERFARSNAKRIAFRMKSEGWKRFSVAFLFNNDTEYRNTFDKDLYMRAFLKDICLRPSCYDCSFKTLNRESDLTLADFWGVQKMMPEMDDDKGTSLILVNSSKGQNMIDQIKDKIILKPVDINIAVSYNQAAIKSAPYNRKRKDFMKNIEKLTFDKLIKKYCNDSISNKIFRKIKVGLRKIFNFIK
jgi:coenzyme F420-reducing hydrogenase beta subunit